MRGLFAVFLVGVLLMVAGVALYDVRAGMVLAGVLLSVVAVFWDGDR